MSNGTTTNDRRVVLFWLLAALCMFVMLPFLGSPDFNTKGEPREAVVSLSMLQTGNWILPVNNGGEIPYKPPFFHWLVAICSLVTGGHVTEYSSRLPSAVALIAMTLATFTFFLRRQGIWTALSTALVAFTTLELHRAGMNTRVDMVLTACTVAAIFSFYRYGMRGMRGIPWLAILFMSLGTLTKGPVGIIIPCLVAGFWLLARGFNFFRIFSFLLLWGVIALIIPAAWYIAAYHQGGKEFLDLVMEENFGRMTNTMSYDSCVNPWPYNILTIITGFIPWTLAALFALYLIPFRQFHDTDRKSWWTRFRTWFRTMDPQRLLSMIAVGVIFIFYCFPQSKRSVYLMPLYPFLALFVTEMLMWMSQRHKVSLKVFGDVIAALAILLTLVFAAVKCGLVPDSVMDHGRHAAQNIAMLHAIRDIGGFMACFWIVAAPAGAVLWWTVWRPKLTPNKLTIAIALVVCGIYMSLAGAYQPAVLNVRSARPVAAQIEALVPESTGNLYEFIGYAEFQKGDPVHFFELNFYLDNRILNFVKEHPRSGFLILSTGDAERYFPQFEKQGYRFDKLADTCVPIAKQPAAVYRFERTGNDTPIRLTSAEPM